MILEETIFENWYRVTEMCHDFGTDKQQDFINILLTFQ